MTTHTTQELQDIASLRIQVHNCEEQIKYFNTIMEQLMNDDVDFDLSFQMHNKTQCATNKARYRVKTLNGEEPFGVRLPYSTNHSACRNEYSVRITESQALNILVALVAEVQKQKTKLQSQLESILKLDYTPIQLLYDAVK
jgi:hypothetical protein